MDCSKRSAGAAAGFPDDPLVEILSRVPAKSVCRFRCVSKAWRDLIDDPLNRRKLPQTLDGFFQPAYVTTRNRDSACFGYTNYLARSVPLDIDPCFSFLTKLPEIQYLCFEDSCNGLILFENYQKRQPFDTVNYIVCNPATKHWGVVPTCCLCLPSSQYSEVHTLLAFDPAVSTHFHLIQIWKPGLDTDEEWLPGDQEFVRAHAYSSATGMWSHIQTEWNEQGQLEGWRPKWILDYGNDARLKRAFFNGILHLIVGFSKYEIVALDLQGRTKRLISTPAPPLAVAEGKRWQSTGYIGQSQGRLHYINQHLDSHDPIQRQSYELSIWVLQDYDTQEWVLKDTVSFLRLYGRMTISSEDFDVVSIHPDCNVIFFLQPLNRLMAYDMNRKEVSVVACFESENLYMDIASYIPYFSESPALPNKH